MLGCGIVHKDVISRLDLKKTDNRMGWASGMGIERMAMFLFNIPDIRLFWSEDERFIDQFQKDKITEFVPFSKYPSCFKDISFYVPENF